MDLSTASEYMGVVYPQKGAYVYLVGDDFAESRVHV